MDTSYVVSWLPFMDSATEDICGNIWTANGTVSISTTNAISGNALQLNKSYLLSNERITFGGQDFTVDFYAYVNSSSEAWTGLFCARQNLGNDNTEQTRPGFISFNRSNQTKDFIFSVYDSSGTKTSGGTISGLGSTVFNGRHHFEINYSHANSTLKIFVDGQINLTITGTIERLARYIFLGTNAYNPSAQRMVGTIDEFRLFDGVALHDADFSPPTAADYAPPYPVTKKFDTQRRVAAPPFETPYLVSWLPFIDSATYDYYPNEWQTSGTVSIGADNAVADNALQLNKGYLQTVEPITFGGQDFLIDFYAYVNSSSEYWTGLFCASTSNAEGSSSYKGAILLHRNNLNASFIAELHNAAGSQQDSGEFSLTLNTRHHFEICYSHADSELIFVVDGVLQATLSGTVDRADRYITLGTNTYQPARQRMVGTIDEFRLFDGVVMHGETIFFDTERVLIDSSTTIIFDTQRVLSQSVATSFDAERVLGGNANFTFDTQRILAHDVDLSFDTERMLIEPSTTIIFDTQRALSQPADVSFDTRRILRGVVNLTFDTQRQLFAVEKILFDTVCTTHAAWLTRILPDSSFLDEKFYASAVALDNEISSLFADTWQALHLPRLDELEGTILDLLAEQFHVDAYDAVNFSDVEKRNLIRQSIAWHRIKGTPGAVKMVLQDAFRDLKVSEWFDYGGDPYYFRLWCRGYTSTPERFKSFWNMFWDAKNVRSHLDKFTIDLSRDEPIRIYTGVARVDAGTKTVALRRPTKKILNLDTGILQFVRGTKTVTTKNYP